MPQAMAMNVKATIGIKPVIITTNSDAMNP
jgi:hypothetical protein